MNPATVVLALSLVSSGELKVSVNMLQCQTVYSEVTEDNAPSAAKTAKAMQV